MHHLNEVFVQLPVLLGDATLKLPFSHLREQSKPVLAFAFGETLLSFLLIALAITD